MSKNDKKLSEQLDELDATLAWFDNPDIDLDAAIKKFEDGVKLADDIKERLETLENKITVIKKRFDA